MTENYSKWQLTLRIFLLTYVQKVTTKGFEQINFLKSSHLSCSWKFCIESIGIYRVITKPSSWHIWISNHIETLLLRFNSDSASNQLNFSLYKVVLLWLVFLNLVFELVSVEILINSNTIEQNYFFKMSSWPAGCKSKLSWRAKIWIHI